MTRLPVLLAAVLAWCVPVVAPAQQQPPVVPAAPPPVYYQPAPQPPIVQGQQSYVQPMVTRTPRTLPYDEGHPIPQGYTRVEKARIGLIVGGSVTFGVSYMLSILAFAIDDSVLCDIDGEESVHCDSDLWPLTIPVVGPFVAMATSEDKGNRSILLLDGIAQVGGVAMIILGVAFRKTILVRNDLASVQLAPLAFEGSLRGMALVGQF